MTMSVEAREESSRSLANNRHHWRQYTVQARMRSLAKIGLVPGQYSTGGKPTVLGMSKRGGAYPKQLLVLGA